jgi:hypothetical protein
MWVVQPTRFSDHARQTQAIHIVTELIYASCNATKLCLTIFHIVA